MPAHAYMCLITILINYTVISAPRYRQVHLAGALLNLPRDGAVDGARANLLL